MTPPAALPALPAATGVRSTPAATSTPRSDAAPNPFDQHLQAARGTQPGHSPAAAKQAPAARAHRDSSNADAAAKHAQESSVSTVASTSATPATGAQSTTTTTAARGQTDATLVDAALAMAQAAPAVAAAGDAATSATSKAATPKTATPDEEGAASLAGAMLAMLGQVTGGMAGASPGADDATVSTDGSASGQAKAAVVSQAPGLDDKALAVAVATPGADLTGLPASMERLLASAGTDTRKDHGLEALALAAAPAPATPAPAPALPQLQLSSSPGNAGFADELGQQVVWLGQQEIREAKIRLHPEDLGSLDVHLSVNHDRVDVVFSAQHPAAVTAVQQSLPQLDHMLARHGLSLGHAEVGQQQNRGDGHARDEGPATTAADEIGEAHGSSLPLATSRVGLLDAFA